MENNFATMPLRFRVWDKEEKRFVPSNYAWGFAIRIDGGISHHHGVIDYGWQNRFIISQDTGLKDKNGKSIYTGDIIKELELALVACYEAGEIRYRLATTTTTSVFPAYAGNTEIVGNIWQNPELLEEK